MSILPTDMLVVLVIGFGLGILCSNGLAQWWNDRKNKDSRP